MTHQRKIWKFPLALMFGPQRISMPIGAVVRATGMDPESKTPALWAECFIPIKGDPPSAEREFAIFATGEPIDTLLHFHGTVMDRQYVWHIFERLID